jgi:WXXGXW repeat (2 copies)
MRTIRYSVLALMLGATPAAMLIATAQAQVSVNIRVNSAPPPLPYYEQPAIPADGYLWVPGYWYWDRSVGDYYWVPGTWVEPPRRGLLWTPAYWSWVEGSYVFYPGYWAREVGFYGGIDYGYGYTGQGYLGGRWENGAFFYNRSVNNIENVRITKVYNQTVVMNSRSNNVSFNGGKGGIAARPTSQQVAFAKERHVEATPVQRQHVEKASKDRALFSKQNHGEPAVAATPRAGVFQGSGVSRGSHTPVATKSNNNVPSTGTEKSGTAVNKETPKVEEAHRPAHEQPKAEEQRRPVQEQPKAEEQHRPVQEQPKAEERRPVQQQPRAEEQRRPVQEPRGNQAPQAPPQRPAAAQAPRPPALAGARPPAVGGQGGGQGSGQGGGGEKR